jgi:vanillate/4-hydroxybenzoate decarboxylase subunit D
MTPSNPNTVSNPVCPRCRSPNTALLTESPVKGAWIVYGCKVCFYTWRTTEPEANTNPDLYPEPFRLQPEEIGKFVVVPIIPVLRERVSMQGERTPAVARDDS